ncbi:MAG: Zn-dependent hydrolase [Gammaproteobacteria bacterium]|nr:Zn-dependent hydrolase [Gammaproteobacteria bacterium]MDH4253555.1 Zn-dependent hydrolase [Gammaproteobacteria bacterium]MDH5310105.1 Zn-dependent hydrolase [Gammaproteobacteria bacterium]
MKAISPCLFAILAAGPIPGAAGAAAGQEPIVANPERMEQRILALSQFGANPEGGVSRVAFSDADIAGRVYISELMRAAGLDVRIDTAGNLIGRRAGRDDGLPPILIGSHIDSVPGGGNYDGDVGVIGALEVVELLNEHRIETRHPLEVVSFTDEEGGLTGSRAMVGKLTDEAMNVVPHSGLTIRDGIRRVGGDPDRLDEAARKPGDLAAYIELHIEQGGILYEEGTDIGVVEGIVGIRWWDVVVEGMANHAGTTPMNRRSDAMVTAAELTLAVNRVATELEGRQVATVGRIQAFPGAPNVVPGKVTMSLEIRDLEAAKMQKVYELIVAEADRIAAARDAEIRFEEIDLAAEPAPTDERMRDIIAAAAGELGLSYRRMPSGAGHDAQDLAQIAPIGMIFVPSVDGISHSPREYTSAEDMANGASVLLHSVLAVDGGALDARGSH